MTPSRRSPFLTGLLLLLAGSVMVFSQDKAKLTEHPFFKHKIGNWKSTGQLTSATSPDVIKITQEWTARFSGEGEFIIEGTRAINDGAPHRYQWIIGYNPTTDLLEARHLDPDQPGDAVRFEGTVTKEPLGMELRGQLSGSGTMTVTEVFKDGDHDTIECRVAFLNESGDTNTSGTLIHRRVKGS